MKAKLIPALMLLIACTSLHAQQIPNGGLNNWTNPLQPDSWTDIDFLVPLSISATVFQDTVDKVEGTASAKLVTDTIPGFSVNGLVPGIISLGSGNLNSGITFTGIPYTGRPDTLFFYYKTWSPLLTRQLSL